MLTANAQTQPHWASAPGETIISLLERRAATVEDLADKLGMSDPDARRLVSGEVEVDLRMAEVLSSWLGGSIQFWVERENQYRESLRWLSADRLASSLPVDQFADFGWVERTGDWVSKASTVLDYFDVNTAEEWNEKWGRLLDESHFRASPSIESSGPTVAAWMRQVQLAADALSVESWSAARFRTSLGLIRALTKHSDPSRFLPELQTLCANAGVAVVVVRAPRGCAISGATFQSNGVRVIGLSARHLTDDHFWFTFYHEAAHVLLHGDGETFLDLIERDSSRSSFEIEADDLAERSLFGTHLPSESFDGVARVRDIIRFASSAGVSPGVVVGALQHAGIVKWERLNGLKRRYKWEGVRLRTGGTH